MCYWRENKKKGLWSKERKCCVHTHIDSLKNLLPNEKSDHIFKEFHLKGDVTHHVTDGVSLVSHL